MGGLEKNHDGVISTDPVNHETMVRERAEKVARIADYIPELKVLGPDRARLLVVSWGGTYGHVLSAYHKMKGEDVAFAHFDWINPLPKNTDEVFSRYEKILVCELNTGQFARYLRGVLPHHEYCQCNKVQGQPFLVHELAEAISENLKNL